MSGPVAAVAPGVPVVEICVDDLAGVLAAERAGADRIELCADLVEGGTTPSIGLIEAVLAAATRVGVQIMVRPRGGDFVYDRSELDVMLADVRAIAARAAGASVPVGIVTGALLPDGTVDERAIAELVAAAGAVPVTFHRAINESSSLLDAYAALARVGVRGVLTSGGAPTALDGAATLAALVAASATPGAPVVVAGGTVRAENVAALRAATGVGELHLRAQVASPAGHLVTDEATVARTVAAARATAGSGGGGASVVPGSASVVAVDIGGTTVKSALVDAAGTVVRAIETPTGPTGADTLAAIQDALVSLSRDGGRVVAAGVASPGLIDAATGTVRYASTLDWTDLPLAAELARAVDVPVALGHDVATAGLAESRLGAAAGEPDAVFAAIGTGVAAALVSGGRVIDGALGAAGELGHIPMVPGGEWCTCGQRGCLEVYFSGAGLARRYAARRADAEVVDAASVIARLGSDPDADAVWAEGVDVLARGLATVTLLVDPAVIVLGGGVAQAGETLLAPLRAALSRALAWREPPRLAVSALGPAAGRIGAAMIAFEAAGLADVPAAWRHPL